MPFLTFGQGAGYYSYGPGVNASNLTSYDIAKANARLAPQQHSIQISSLKATRGDVRSPAKKATHDTSTCTYANWSEGELSKAVVARRIESDTAAAEMNKDDLVKTLEEADKDSTFSRFLDLSAELRNEIYKLAIADVNSTGSRRVRPVTPAISRTNRQIRTETLPLFFGGICQTIVISSEPVGPIPFRRQQAVISDKYENYFNHARRVGWLQHMRRFQFRLMGQTLGRDGRTRKYWNARYYIQFAKNMQSVRVWTDEEGNKEGALSSVKAGMKAINDGESTVMTAKQFFPMVIFFLDMVDLRLAE